MQIDQNTFAYSQSWFLSRPLSWICILKDQASLSEETEEKETELITQGVNSDWRVTIAVTLTTVQIYNSFEYSQHLDKNILVGISDITE